VSPAFISIARHRGSQQVESLAIIWDFRLRILDLRSASQVESLAIIWDFRLRILDLRSASGGSIYNSEPHPLQNLSLSSIGSPQLRQNSARDCFSTCESIGWWVLGEGRRETICQIKAPMIMRPPIATATKAQLRPEPVVDGGAGKAGVCMLVFGAGKLVADN